MLSLRFFSMGSGKMNCRLDMQNFISSKHGTSCPYIFLKQALFCPAGVFLIIPQTLLGSLGKSASVDLSYFVLILGHEQHCVMLDHSIDNKLIVCQPILCKCQGIRPLHWQHGAFSHLPHYLLQRYGHRRHRSVS